MPCQDEPGGPARTSRGTVVVEPSCQAVNSATAGTVTVPPSTVPAAGHTVHGGGGKAESLQGHPANRRPPRAHSGRVPASPGSEPRLTESEPVKDPIIRGNEGDDAPRGSNCEVAMRSAERERLKKGSGAREEEGREEEQRRE
eukprot:133580-Hanusia_phi.AAC.1